MDNKMDKKIVNATTERTAQSAPIRSEGEYRKEWTCRFKKHLNKTWSEVWRDDPQYVQWVMTQGWIDTKLKGYIISQPFYQ
jgi:hypothetical protein